VRLPRRLRRDAPRGQALVETAVALLFVLLPLLLTIDVGRVIVAHIELLQATEEGSIYAAYELGGFPTKAAADGAVATRITTSSNRPAVAGATVTVACGARIRVESTYPMPMITPLGHALFGENRNIEVVVIATNFHKDVCP
jgi:Flp pilus assembly protein TadG